MRQDIREEITTLHAHVCSGLSEPTRILILYILAEEPHNVGELVAMLDLPQPTVSRHLKVLRSHGMVVAERQGTSVQCSLADERIIKALDMLREFMADKLEHDSELARTPIELPGS